MLKLKNLLRQRARGGGGSREEIKRKLIQENQFARSLERRILSTTIKN
jgi:hypothetical protein